MINIPGDAAQGKHLFAESMQPACRPRPVGELGLPLRVPPDLARHTLLHLAMDGDSAHMLAEWEPWLSAWGLSDLGPAARLSFSSYSEAIAAALAGQGVALGSGRWWTRCWPAASSSRRSTPASRQRGPTGSSSTLRPSHGRAVKAFEQWLLAECGAPAVE